jgi:1-acyl-sn-glycerol-3-phosphate acyltransferase
MPFLAAPLSGSFLFVTLLLANTLQILTLVILPFSKYLFRRANRWIAHGWWGLAVLWALKVHQIRPVFSGDKLPEAENAIVISNHQCMPDIVALMILAWPHKRLGDMKWFVKDIIKYFPGVGWGMLFLDCVFLKRNWDKDAHNIKKTFSKFLENKIPLWLMSFPEGTRLTPQKLAQAQSYAHKTQKPLPQNVLIPRARGFAASVTGLRTHINAVYDVTLIYPKGAPNMWQLLSMFKEEFHIHVQRHDIKTLPQETHELSEWLLKRFEEKDLFISSYSQ